MISLNGKKDELQMKQEYKCNKHDEYYTNLCVSIQCLCALCPECIEEHIEYHLNNQMGQAQISSIKNVKQNCVRKIDAMNQQIEAQINQIQKNEITVQNEINQLKIYKQSLYSAIESEFQKMEDQLKQQENQFQKKNESIKEMIRDIKNYQQLYINDQNQLNMNNKLMVIQKIVDICKYDMNKDLKVVKQKFQQIQQLQQNEQTQIILDEQKINDMKQLVNQYIKLKHYSVNEMDKQIQLDNSKSIHIDQQDSVKKGCQSYLHFFENGTKRLNLYYFGETSRTELVQVDLKINFEIPVFHKSLQLKDNQLYLSGGSQLDGTKSRQIYKYDFQRKTLDFVGNMLTQRSSHGMIQVGNQIYLVGGFTIDQKVTKNCEKYDISGQTCQTIASLNSGSNNFSLAVFKDLYIYKFGGLCVSNHSDNRLMDFYIEKYDIQNNNWEILNIDISNIKKQFRVLVSSAAIQINRSQILIIGGYFENDSGSQYSMIYDENKNSVWIDNQHPLLHKDGFWSDQLFIKSNQIWGLQNITEGKDVIMDSKRLIRFDQSWQSF